MWTPTSAGTSWDEDLENVELFKAVLPQVRRVLANVPSLMIFDDHEITDDWNIDLAVGQHRLRQARRTARGDERRARLRLVPALGEQAGSIRSVGHAGARRAGRGLEAVDRLPAQEPGAGRTAAARHSGRQAADGTARASAARPDAAGAIRYDLPARTRRGVAGADRAARRAHRARVPPARQPCARASRAPRSPCSCRRRRARCRSRSWSPPRRHSAAISWRT